MGSCRNTEGSFECRCPNGQRVHSNKKDCVGKEFSMVGKNPRFSCFAQPGEAFPEVLCDSAT